MRQSASMAEIATEDGTSAEEEESALEDSQPKEGKREEDDEGQSASESESSAETSPSTLESDSDTEEEEEEEVETNSSPTASASAHLKQTPPEIQTGVTQPLLSASHTSSSPSVLPTGGLNVIPGITVTEATPPPGTPPSPGRCISVSSPGRGRKIFMVTRVESPPEQQQLQQQLSVSASPRQSTEDSKTAVEGITTTTQQTESPDSSPTPTQTRLIQEENSPAPSADSQARVHSPSHTHTLQPQSADQQTEDVNTSTLDPDEINPSQLAPSQPSGPSPTQLTEEATESLHGGEGQHEENLKAEEQVFADGTEGESDGDGEMTHIKSQQQPVISASEEIQAQLISVTEEIPAPIQTEDATEMQQRAQDKRSETRPPSSIKTSQEELCENHQNGIGKGALGVVMTQQQASSPSQSAVQEQNPSAGEDSQLAGPVALENSPSSSAEKYECSSEAVEDVIGSALPNGLKAEFSLHLLESESPKSGSCVMDHGEFAPSPSFDHFNPGRCGI